MSTSCLPFTPARYCPLDISDLRSLVAAFTEEHDALACYRIIHSIAWSPVDASFPDAFTYCPTITKVTVLQSEQSGGDSGAGLLISQTIKPLGKQIYPGYCCVVLEFIHVMVSAAPPRSRPWPGAEGGRPYFPLHLKALAMCSASRAVSARCVSPGLALPAEGNTAVLEI